MVVWDVKMVALFTSPNVHSKIAGHHFIHHLLGSGKDWAQNYCIGGRVDLITGSLILDYREVLQSVVGQEIVHSGMSMSV